MRNTNESESFDMYHLLRKCAACSSTGFARPQARRLDEEPKPMEGCFSSAETYEAAKAAAAVTYVTCEWGRREDQKVRADESD